ncbi:MAG: dockerin type I domain-containing protein, partial [Pirellulaceae bacterium]
TTAADVQLTLFGNGGNDRLIGADQGGANAGDFLFGGPGDDRLEGGTGQDQMFGEDGGDLFVWVAGDGSDLMEGGSGESDELQFIANDSDNRLEIFGGGSFGSTGNPAPNVFVPGTLEDGSRVIFALNSTAPDAAQVFLNLGDVETIDVDALGGADEVTINNQVDTTSVTGGVLQAGTDLAQSTLAYVTVDLGDGDVATDNVNVHGRLVEDDIHVTYRDTNDDATSDRVDVAGLPFEISITNSLAVINGTTVDPSSDRLTIDGNDGDDEIKVAVGVENLIGITLNGDAGDDFLSADAIINGGPGNDFLQGGALDDTLNGNAGEDVMVGGAGNDLFDGGPDFDTILISGTSGDDMIDVVEDQPAAFAPNVRLQHTVNGVTENDEVVVSGGGDVTVERAMVEAGDGQDLIRFRIADEFFDDAGTGFGLGMVMEVDGGDQIAAGDRLVIVDDATEDLVLYRKEADATAGTVTIGPSNAEPFQHVFTGIERVQFVDEAGAAINSEPGNLSRLVVFKHDPFEYNDDRFVATYVGANETTVNLDPTIDPGALINPFGDDQDLGGDEDWFRVEAAVTGTLDLQVFFEEVGTLASGRPGLPGDGNLDIELYDVDATLIAGSGPNFGINDGPNELEVDGDVFAEDERIRIPAVQGQTYYLRVVGNSGAATNNYNVTIINPAPPTPYDLELDDLPPNGTPNPPGQSDNSDTGRSQFDNHTYDSTPVIRFRLDDAILLHDLPGNPADDTPPDEVIDIPFRAGPAQPLQPGFAIALFDEGTPQQPGALPQVPIGFATQVAEGVYTFDFSDIDGAGTDFTLTDGSHFLSARVQIIDPADPQQNGFGARSESFEIVVDTVEPPVFFGVTSTTTDGLHPDSDSGVQGPGPGNELESTFSDRITNDRTPTFYGLAEADSFIRVYVDVNQNNAVDGADVLLGQTVAVPFDGTNQFGNATGDSPNGQWELTSTVDLNDPEARDLNGDEVALGFDGLRRILVTAEDLAGNINAVAGNAQQILDIFVDTQGPQITDVDINSQGNAYDLFGPKPSEDGPTPLVSALVISVQDLPERIAAFLYPALEHRGDRVDVPGDDNHPAENPGHYELRGDYNGLIPIESVTFSPVNNANAAATGTITLSLFEPIPDDRYTLTVRDAIVDPAGNALDGETNTAEPQENPTLPSGDGQPGGDFVARFTVDSRPELGAWASGSVWVDTNGNSSFDPGNPDFTNRDITYAFGNGSKTFTDRAFTSDDIFAGDFSIPDDDSEPYDGGFGKRDADGFDKLAAYGSVGWGINGPWRWIVDTDNDGVPNINQIDPASINGLPVAGNFDGDTDNGDEVALFTGKPDYEWYFDTVSPYYQVDASVATPQLDGYPIVGDFDGDGYDDLGTWADDTFKFLLTNGVERAWLDGSAVYAEIDFGFIGVRERPVAADMDGDGIDDIGLWVPDRSGVTPGEGAEWYFLVSNDPLETERLYGEVNTLSHAFTPIPFGKDLYAQFGDEYAIPVIGNFDPPVALGTGSPKPGDQTNASNPLDTSADGFVTSLDALLVINAIAREGSFKVTQPGRAVHTALDANADLSVTPLDALVVINFLNGYVADAEGEAGGVAAPFAEEPLSEDL